MFDEKKVLSIIKRSKAESWPYPKVFDTLKEAGVQSYEVKVENFLATYKNGDQEWLEPMPKGFYPLKASERFDEQAIKDALTHRSQNETTYVEFLRDLASAGVVSYRVDMPTRAVVYRGRKNNESYLQVIPSL